MRKVMSQLAVFVGTLALAATATAAPVGYAVQSNGNGHLYQIDLATGAAVDLGLVGQSDLEGLTWVGNTLYAIGGTAAEFWNITTTPGVLVGATGPREGVDAGLGDAPDGTVYNIQGTGGASTLYTINTTTGAATLVGRSGIFADNLGINAAGLAFAADAIFSDSLYSVNLTNGALTLVGGLGLGNISQQAGMDFDAAGNLWMLFGNGSIYTVNTTTGAATFVAQTLSGFEGLAIQGGQQAVPEPASMLLLGTGLAGLAARLRRRTV